MPAVRHGPGTAGPNRHRPASLGKSYLAQQAYDVPIPLRYR
jgi:hypothetical protein